jgi:hypothetical protein
LATWLGRDGITALDVPAKLATRVRMLSTGHGRKNDDADAVSVGIAALTASGLRAAGVEDTIIGLRALVEHRDDVVGTRTQTVNRLHVLLCQLLPGGAARQLSADTAARLLATVRPAPPEHAPCVDWPPSSSRRSAIWTGASPRSPTTSPPPFTARGTTLIQLRGIGELTAAKTLARVGDINRFRSRAAFASYTGTAPIEASSGDVVRHRLSRAGDRQLNYCLHTMAITQIRHPSPGRDYYLRKRATGKSHKEALRCLKRRLSDVVYRQLILDAHPQATGPRGHQGATP